MVGNVIVEPKLDGVRVIVICDVDKDEVKLFSRNGKELSNFPEINKYYLSKCFVKFKLIDRDLS